MNITLRAVAYGIRLRSNFRRTLHHTNRFSTSSDTEIKQRVLDAALRYVPAVGWTDDALALAVKEIGYDSTSHKIIDKGAVDLVKNFMRLKREHVNKVLEAKYGNAGSEEQATQEKRDEIIYAAIEAHLDYISPFISSWSSALAVLAEPLQVPDTIQLMTDVADDICHHAGLKSSRLDWYTDRGLVLAVFCSAELYMLTDYSNNLEDTRDFLRRNIGLIQQLKNSSPSILSLLQSTIVPAFISAIQQQAASNNVCQQQPQPPPPANNPFAAAAATAAATRMNTTSTSATNTGGSNYTGPFSGSTSLDASTPLYSPSKHDGVQHTTATAVDVDADAASVSSVSVSSGTETGLSSSSDSNSSANVKE